jgi:hypothetical protein
VSVKPVGECTFSSTKTITKQSNRSDISGNYISNVKCPGNADYQITLKLVSPCVIDYYFGLEVRFTWNKTISSTTKDVDMGFGKKSSCVTTGSSSGGSSLSKATEHYLEVCQAEGLIQY